MTEPAFGATADASRDGGALSSRDEIAAVHIVKNVATARSTETIDQTFQNLRGRSFGSLDNVHVLDGERLIGIVPLTRLMAERGETRIGDIMQTDVPPAGLEIDQEELLSLAHDNRIAAPPVVDGEGRLQGCVPPIALIDIGRREHAEDISRLAGILHSETRGRHAFDETPWHRAIHRLPWLIVGLIGSGAATLVMVRFESLLSSQIAVAFFVPAIVYIADAIGTQTEAVTVRGLSFLNAPKLSSLLFGELSTGFLIGAALGAISLLSVYLFMGDLRLALAVAAAISLAGPLAAASGLILPWLLSRMNLDPAFGSGPVATVIQDVLSLLVYFSVVQLIVRP